MGDYLQGFVLGNAAIASNVCVLPLYPSLFVLLAARNQAGDARASGKWLGAVVLAGLLTALIGLGWIFHAIRASFADVIPTIMPVRYVLILVLGVATLVDRNPLARLGTAQLPVLARPVLGAYVYGALLAPLTLPCIGPLVIAAFTLGTVGGTGKTISALGYVVTFGLGFGWPLVVIPFLAIPLQRRALRVLTRHHRIVTILSGALLVVVALIGLRSLY